MARSEEPARRARGEGQRPAPGVEFAARQAPDRGRQLPRIS